MAALRKRRRRDSWFEKTPASDARMGLRVKPAAVKISKMFKLACLTYSQNYDD